MQSITRGSGKASLPRGNMIHEFCQLHVLPAQVTLHEMAKKPTKRPRADKNKKAARHAKTGNRFAQDEDETQRSGGRGKPPAEPSAKKAAIKTVSLNPLMNTPFVEIEDPRLRSRLIYANPVCILTCVVPDSTLEKCPEVKWRQNAMILSWLTPINNEGGFVCSMHKRRFSSECIIVNRRFVLSVPVKGMEELVLAIGGDTGKKTSKFQSIAGLRTVEVGHPSIDVVSRVFDAFHLSSPMVFIF
jgi:flavin reductase (DIM6/NTAB) family NADH-FMN oxidoreductase RutF